MTDNGEGIDRERVAKVFDAYFSTRAEGMGMGLAISRTIVEAHQGQITVASQPGVKTTFRFTCRAALSTMIDPMVYIVDDDPDMREFAASPVENVGCTTTFSSAAEFVAGFSEAPDRRWCSTSGCRERAAWISSSI